MEVLIRNQIRLALIKLRQYNTQGEIYESNLRKLIGPSTDGLDILLSKLLSLQIKNDYQYLIIMTFLTEIVVILNRHFSNNRILSNKIDNTISTKALQLLQSENISKQIQNLFSLKKIELIRVLFYYKISTSQYSSEFFLDLYNILRECQNNPSNTIREHFKITFINIHKMIIENCKSDVILDLIFNQVFTDSCKAIELKGKQIIECVRILDTRILILQQFIQKIVLSEINLHKIIFLIIKMSVIENIYIVNLNIGLSQLLITKIMEKTPPILAIILNHSIFNELNWQLTNGNDNLCLQMLLNQVLIIFKNEKLLLKILKQNDLNIYSEEIISDLVNNLYNYLEKEEKKNTENVKKCLKLIMEAIKQLLANKRILPFTTQLQHKHKFYHIKKTQYKTMVEQFNRKPKIFLDKFKNLKTQSYQIDQFVHFLRKSPHIQNKLMIQVFGLETQISKILLKKYIATFKIKGYTLQQALRIFLSNFFLNGQSQQVNRVIQQFTLNYSSFQKAEDWNNNYVFTTAILILNTDLHNPVNQKKMTEQQFLKICSNLKSNEDIINTYASISKNKIQTFRTLKSLQNINFFCFLYNHLTQKDFWTLGYIDSTLNDFQNNSQDLYEYLAYENLQNILVGKEIQKLNKLIDTFVYKQDVYQCQILSILNLLVSRNKSQIPLTAYQMIDKKVVFNTQQISQKYFSYYWLQAKIISQYFQYIPISNICNFLIGTYRIRKMLEDDFFTRCRLKLKRLKQSLKIYKSKLGKKGSILERFASFLGQKQQSTDDEIQVYTEKKMLNFKKLSLQIFDNLSSNTTILLETIKYLDLKTQQSKIPVNQFISTFLMLLDLVYNYPKEEAIGLIWHFFQEIIVLKDSLFTKRMIQLKKNKESKYDIIVFLTKYYFIKIILENLQIGLRDHRLFEETMSFVQNCNPDILLQIINRLKTIKTMNFKSIKLIKSLQKAIYKNYKQNHIHDQDVKKFIIHLKTQEVCSSILMQLVSKIESSTTIIQKQSQIKQVSKQLINGQTKIQMNQSPRLTQQQNLSPKIEQQQQVIHINEQQIQQVQVNNISNVQQIQTPVDPIKQIITQNIDKTQNVIQQIVPQQKFIQSAQCQKLDSQSRKLKESTEQNICQEIINIKQEQKVNQFVGNSQLSNQSKIEPSQVKNISNHKQIDLNIEKQQSQPHLNQNKQLEEAQKRVEPNQNIEVQKIKTKQQQQLPRVLTQKQILQEQQVHLKRLLEGIDECNLEKLELPIYML